MIKIEWSHINWGLPWAQASLERTHAKHSEREFTFMCGYFVLSIGWRLTPDPSLSYDQLDELYYRAWRPFDWFYGD